MSAAVKASRAQVWMENLGEWSWPGRVADAGETLPPAWVPAFPPRLEPVAAPAAMPGSSAPSRAGVLAAGAPLRAVAAVCAVVALNGPLPLERLLGLHASGSSVASATAGSAGPALPPPPPLVAVSHDAAGSSIDRASFASSALHGPGSLLVYVPPGY